MNPQHALYTNGASSSGFRLRVIGLNHQGQLFPGDDLFHLAQKLLLTGFLPEFLKTALAQSLFLMKIYYKRM